MIIEAKDIVKTFGPKDKKTAVLNGVSVRVADGEFVAVMGPSGSGKSTLMYALSGMDTIDSGSVSFEGGELTQLSEKELAALRRDRMGFVFQQPTMLKSLTILDNILLPAAKGGKPTKELVQHAKKLMDHMGLEGLEERDITEVSGGQLQRAGICRAMINEPAIIFGDEPTGALNSKSASAIISLLKDVNKNGTTVLLVTHDAKVAAAAQRVVFVKDGEIEDELAFEDEPQQQRSSRVVEKMQELEI